MLSKSKEVDYISILDSNTQITHPSLPADYINYDLIAGVDALEVLEGRGESYGSDEQAPAFPHAPELLQQLRDDGYRLAIVTNRSEIGANSGVKWAGWKQHFEVVVGQDTAARAKPYPDPAHFALAALGVESGAAAFIGDNETDIRCGAAAGLAAVVALADGEKADLLRSIGATHVSADLHELFYSAPA